MKVTLDQLTGAGSNAYEAKQACKKERLHAAADRARERSDAAYKKADLREEVSGIPFGQPILVGHHSEGRHRAAIKRADNAMRTSIEEDQKAKRLDERAQAVGTGGISSDDPDAISKLRVKLESAKTVQAFMREANKLVRAQIKKGNTPATISGDDLLAFADQLRAIPGGEKISNQHAADLLKPDFAGRHGFADFQLINNSSTIRRIEKRLAILEANAQRATKEVDFQGVCKVVENAEENRLQLIFPGKPSDAIRATLKSLGFRWAPSANAWQRQLTNSARYAARCILVDLKVDE